MIDCDCPRCGSRNTKAFSVLHQDGTRDFRYRRTGLFYYRRSLGAHTSTTRGRNQSVTAQLTAPSVPPMTRFLQGAGVPVTLVISALLGGAPGFWLGLAVLAVLAVVVGQHDTVAHDQTARKWAATFRCNRCGTVFAVIENVEGQSPN